MAGTDSAGIYTTGAVVAIKNKTPRFPQNWGHWL